MLDGVLDFLVMMLVLGVVTGTSMNLTIPIVEEVNQLAYDEIYDKTAEKIQGDNYVYKGDGCMGYEELILTIMNQTYFMPKPRMMDVCGEVLAVKPDQPDDSAVTGESGVPPAFNGDDALEFVENDINVGNWARNQIHNWYVASDFTHIPITELRFDMRFDLGETEQYSDDMYAVFILHQGPNDKEPTLHRCLAGGRIR